jgi:hypothetical protein
MSRRRMSKAEGQALAALFVALLVVAWALLVATIKAAGAILRWIGVTAADLHSTDPARNQRGRARLATVMSAVLVLAGYAVVSAHSTRTLWHESHASWEFMGLAAVIAVGSLVVLTWRVATGFAATIPWKFALVFFVPAMLLASVVWATDRPTLASAQRQLHASQFDAARESAAAIVGPRWIEPCGALAARPRPRARSAQRARSLPGVRAVSWPLARPGHASTGGSNAARDER